MVDNRAQTLATTNTQATPAPGGVRPSRRPLRTHLLVTLAIAAALVALAIVVGSPGAKGPGSEKSVPSAVPAGHVSPTTTAPTASTPAEAVASVQTPLASGAVTTPTTTPVAQPTVATLVAQVEAAGIVPPSSWSWSMGDTAAACGVSANAGGAAGCTSWSAGVERTVFAGSPTLALVAHEVANAETEQSALPELLQEVSTAAAGSSWSPTDAVASCLVAHFMGFQDDAAGTWQCPSTLAATVAAHIHDTVVTTRTTAVCGTTSGIVSTLTFTAGAGTLTVTSPSTSQTASAGVPVTVTGVGTFTATDEGGTATVVGTCEG